MNHNHSSTFFSFRIFRLIVGLVIILITNDLLAQRIRKSMDDRFTEHYHVLKSDTTKKDGEYKLFYKSTLVEKGCFKKGVRSGVWTFFNLGGNFEFQYDFDSDSIIQIAGADFYSRRNERPSLFLGSPLVPYVFISNKVGYPLEAIEKGIKGKVVLTLKISETGQIIDRYISQGLNNMMDTAVIKAAWSFPENWEWIPAKRGGEPIESLYNITVYFELD